MQIVNQPQQMQALAKSWSRAGLSVGFVPTMGALHEGHMELCRRAAAENDRFVASIFVNPAQFLPHEDLAKYPRPFERDAEMLRAVGCAAIFHPSPESMYGGADFLHRTWIDVLPLSELWEGVTRPGHLRGVATVVAKLFNIVKPDRAYFGEKDFQQLKVVESLVSDLNFDLDVVPVPTLREPDGLALSSRNVYLSPEERVAATGLQRAIQAAGAAVAKGERDVTTLGRLVDEVLAGEPLIKSQYVAIVDAVTLEPLTWVGDGTARLLLAAFLGHTRLIDNGPL